MNSLIYAARPLLEDFFSTLIFVVLIALKVDVRIATAAAISVGVLQLAWRLLRGKPIPGLQWMGLGLVLVFGTASLITHDVRFVMFKPSIIYVIIGGAMLQRGWMLRYMPPIAAGHGQEIMTAFGYVWAGLMFVTAILNAVVAIRFTSHWVAFAATFPLVSKIGLFVIQYVTVRMVVKRKIIAARATEGLAQAA
jgi:intracellular septation protein